MLIATFCTLSERLVAVTTISLIALVAAAGCSAAGVSCAIAGVNAKAEAEASSVAGRNLISEMGALGALAECIGVSPC